MFVWSVCPHTYIHSSKGFKSAIKHFARFKWARGMGNEQTQPSVMLQNILIRQNNKVLTRGGANNVHVFTWPVCSAVFWEQNLTCGEQVPIMIQRPGRKRLHWVVSRASECVALARKTNEFMHNKRWTIVFLLYSKKIDGDIIVWLRDNYLSEINFNFSKENGNDNVLKMC